MTDKQRKCIQWICEILHVKYYGKDTRRDAWLFIHKFMDKAKEVQRDTDFINTWGLSFLLNSPM